MDGASGMERRGEGHGGLGRRRCALLRARPERGEMVVAISQCVRIRSRLETRGWCIWPGTGWRLRGRGLFLARDGRKLFGHIDLPQGGVRRWCWRWSMRQRAFGEFGDQLALEVVGGADEGDVIGISGGKVAAPELDEALAMSVPDGEARLGGVMEGGHGAEIRRLPGQDLPNRVGMSGTVNIFVPTGATFIAMLADAGGSGPQSSALPPELWLVLL